MAEYVATTLLLWADEHARNLSKYTVGVVGAGHVGSAVQKLLDNLGIPVVAYDPPRQLRDPDFYSTSLKEILKADILTFHVPLTHEGPYPTRYWLDANKLRKHTFDLVINTSRGGVIHENALLQAFANKSIGDMIIDVWENEPLFDDALAQQAFIGTPHIAGYSIQAKLNASQIICDKLIQHFELPANDTDCDTRKTIKTSVPDDANSISEVLTSIHPVLEYQENLMRLVGEPTSVKGSQFNKLRAEFPLRNEFYRLDLPFTVIKRLPLLSKIIS